MDQQRPLVLIGLDGADWKMLTRAAADGCIDFLSSKMSEGVSGTLHSTVPPLTCPAVPTLFSGLNPGRLGVFDFVKPNGDPVSSNDIPAPALWEIASDQGRRCCVTNMRFAYPPRPLNGVLVCGDLTRGNQRSYTHPPELMHEIGDYHPEEIHERIEQMRKNREMHQEALLQDNLTVMCRRFDVFHRLCAETSFDLAVHWVGQTDSIQHHSWDHPEIVVQLYHAVDEQVRRMQATFPDANFVIVSDHGFDAAAAKAFFVNTWLRERGFLCGRAVVGMDLANWLKRHLPSRWKKRVKAALQRHRYGECAERPNDGLIAFPGSFSLQPGIRHGSTSAYLACPWGIAISPDLTSTEREAVVDQIVEELSGFADADGKPVVQQVWRREELYSGEFVRHLPQILFLTDSDYRAMPSLASSELGPLRPTPTFAGEHDRSRQAILIAWGPDIPSGVQLDADMVDITPTALHLMGCAIPSDLDGTPFETLADAKVRYTEPSTMKETTGETFSEEERQAVRRRLQNLGYL